MKPSRPSPRVALLIGVLVAASCVDGDPAGVGTRVETGVAILASFASASSSASGASEPRPPTHARVTARSAGDGVVMGRSLTAIDSTASEWSLQVRVEIPTTGTVTLLLLVELVSARGEVETVEWSGRTGELSLSAAAPDAEVRKIPLYRGPPANLDVSAVFIDDPDGEVTEGDALRLTAAAEGSPGALVYFSSLDPSVATTTPDGLVTTLSAGTARIRAEAGPRADTVLLRIRSFPLPPREEVEGLSPAVADGMDRIGPNLEDQASADAIVSALGDVTAALGKGEGLAAAKALERAWDALRNYGTPGSRYRDGPELSLIELLLIHMERLLHSGD